MLHESIISGRSLCFNFLLKQPQLDINAQDNQGWTPLFWAVNRGLEHFAQDLVGVGCDISKRDLSLNTALHEVGVKFLPFLFATLLARSSFLLSVPQILGT